MAAPLPSGSAQAAPPTTLWGKLDATIHRFERGVVVVSLLTLAFAYFFDIVSVEVAAADNAFDRIVYRLSGFSQHERPDEAFRQLIHTRVTPAVASTLTFALALFAVSSTPAGRNRSWGLRFAFAFGAVASLAAGIAAIALLPSAIVCGATLIAFVAAFAFRAHQRGQIVPYLIMWTPGLVAFGWLLTNIGPGYAWAQDLGKLLIMWMGFVGASMATRERKHIQIDFVRKALGPARVGKYNAISYVVTIAFCLVLGALAISYLLHEHESGATLSSVPIRGSWLVFPIVWSLLLMVARFSGRAILAARGLEVEMGGAAELPPPSEASA